MNDTELRLAIDQAWAHTEKTAPGAALREAEEHLTHLRAVQADRAKSSRRCSTEPPPPPRSSTGI